MKTLTIALKDVKRSLRSAFMIGMCVAAPLLLTGLMYFAFGGMSKGTSGLPALKVGIVNVDTLPTSAPLTEPLGNTIRSIFFDESVAYWISASDYPDEASARQALDRQEIGAAVIVPANFTAGFLAGSSSATITLVQDPTLTVTPLIVRSMLTSLLDGISSGGIAYKTISDRQQSLGISADPAGISSALNKYETWYASFQRDLYHNPDQAVLKMSAPATDQSQPEVGMAGILKLIMAGQMIFFAFFTGGYAMLSILQEQEEGTLARLFTTPTSRTLILAGKFLAVVLIVILQGLVLMVTSHFAFGVDWGNPGAASLALLGQVAAASGLGVLLIAFVKTSRQGGPLLGGLLAALGMMGGLFTVSVPSAAALFDKISKFTPQGWVLVAWRAVLNGGSAGAVLLPLAVCIAIGLVTFTGGAAMFRRRFA
jgi:ABC-2 type transport system permease protein